MLGAILLPERNCVTCKSPEWAKWGCHEPTTIPQLELDGELVYRCPMRPWLLKSHSIAEILRMRQHWHEGHFPDAGTYLDQPLRLVQLIEILDAAHSAAETVKRERDEAKGRVTARTARAGARGRR